MAEYGMDTKRVHSMALLLEANPDMAEEMVRLPNTPRLPMAILELARKQGRDIFAFVLSQTPEDVEADRQAWRQRNERPHEKEEAEELPVDAGEVDIFHVLGKYPEFVVAWYEGRIDPREAYEADQGRKGLPDGERLLNPGLSAYINAFLKEELEIRTDLVIRTDGWNMLHDLMDQTRRETTLRQSYAKAKYFLLEEVREQRKQEKEAGAESASGVRSVRERILQAWHMPKRKE